ncbi:surfeit locus protein 2-like [Haliotis asinina]|uniref:surfeit locus protein 2-like n=1 Tax=Haliotis asinina TaxID=109174 RepID=UPI003531B0B5
MASKEHVKALPKEIKELLEKYPVLEHVQDSNKIKCTLSGHEMPCKPDIVSGYVNGKKFIKLYKDKEYNYDRLKPHLVPSTKKHHEHQLFCLLTFTHINKTPTAVDRHLKGRKYGKALKRWTKCQETGEAFRPLRKRKREEDESRQGKSFYDSDRDSDVDTDDSYSDLYPPEYFGGDGLNSDFECDVEEDEEAAAVTSLSNTGSKKTSKWVKQKQTKKHKKMKSGD